MQAFKLITKSTLEEKIDVMITEKDLLTIKEASKWASNYLKKNVTTSKISYLVQILRKDAV